VRRGERVTHHNKHGIDVNEDNNSSDNKDNNNATGITNNDRLGNHHHHDAPANLTVPATTG